MKSLGRARSKTGNTASDFAEEEQQYHHSLQPSILHFVHEGHHVNVIDTPGMSDFIGHAIACFPAVESVVIVIDAAKGIESEARRLMQVATDRNLPRMILVNKIDIPEADLERSPRRFAPFSAMSACRSTCRRPVGRT